MKELKMLPLRIIVFPFAIIVVLLYANYGVLKWAYGFLLYGGEFIALTKANDRKKVYDVYEKVLELVDTKNDEYARYVCRLSMYYDIKQNLWYDPNIEGGITGDDLYAQFMIERSRRTQKE